MTKPRQNLVALCGSAGSFQLILDMVRLIPDNSPCSWVILLHQKYFRKSKLPDLLGFYTRLKIKEAEDKEPIQPSTIYIAPSNYHLLLEPDMRWSLDSSEPVFYCRPAIDPLLQSMADVLGSQCSAFLLSGANEDGALGMALLHRKGARVFIQDPQVAEHEIMPDAALLLEPGIPKFRSEQLDSLIRMVSRLSHHQGQ